jgi:hypothetical protein
MALAEASRQIKVLLQKAGVAVREDSFWVQEVSKVQNSVAQVVVSFSSAYWVQQLMEPGVRAKIRELGVSYNINLTVAEMANRRAIKQHPKFQAALKRIPAGSKVIWRLDACVIDSKWTATSEVWTASNLAVAERADVDLSGE